ncbi:MAG: hypothetical protein AMS22_01735 [Thiotrichales bacterium SG8_50]|nr:MAG: hypothetical protein AMS22_01735 [Thiotrichales bacterium SG8_50]
MHLANLIALAILACSCAAATLQAQESSVRPGINQPYQQPDYDQWVNVFEQPGREVYERRAYIIDQLQLRPGMHVADVGAGTGFFSMLIAEEVGESGHVFAVDIAPEFIDKVVTRAAANEVRNLSGIVNSPRSSGLEENSLDLVFLCDTYHHFEFPYDMNQSLYRALKPGGLLYVIDYRKQEGRSSSWVMGHVRTDEAAVIVELTDAGFRFDKPIAGLEQNFFLRFVKPAH